MMWREDQGCRWQRERADVLESRYSCVRMYNVERWIRAAGDSMREEMNVKYRYMYLHMM